MDQQKPTSEEIDLGQVFKKIGEGFKSAGIGTLRFIATLRRIPLENKFSFVGIITVSVILAIAYSSLLKKNYYESTMILSSQYLNKRLVDNTIAKLDILAEEDDKKELARLFNIPDTLALIIEGFEARPFISENDLIEVEILKEQLRNAQNDETNKLAIEDVMKRIEVENRHSFEITIRTLNPSVIPNLQDALVGYFRNNAYVKRRIEINKLNLKQKKEKLINDLEKMDSLKRIIYANYKTMAEQGRAGSNNVILSDRAVTNPVEIYAQDLDLYEKLQAVDRELYLQPDFEVVDNFTAFSEPASTSTPRMILYALMLGILVAYLDVALRTFNTYLSTFD
jgi:hypothetical protein